MNTLLVLTVLTSPYLILTPLHVAHTHILVQLHTAIIHMCG